MHRLIRATMNSIRGLKAALRTDAAVREELFVLALAVPVGWLLAPSLGWFVAMIGGLMSLVAVEMLNTAIEKLADHVTPENNPRIGTIKDMGSTAVLFAMTAALLIWIAALAERLGLD
ncbi:MAG: diacylglycerol kinase [Blastochloris sp.]|nr:diacylglycerol kinase [Blastochloris sp.]